jgi:heme-degrading monooxygenase HmoA
MALVRMSRWRTRPGLDAESLRLWSDSVLAVWRTQPGLIQVHLLALEGTDERMTLSVWSSSEAYEAFASSDALRTVASAFDEIYTENGRPSATVWNVLTEDWPGRAS